MECFSCKKITIETVNIYDDPDNDINPIKHLEAFLGVEFTSHLKPLQQICRVCQKMYEEIAKIKYQIEETILNPLYEIPANYGIFWQFLYEKYIRQSGDYDDSEHNSYDPLTPSSYCVDQALSDRSSSRNADAEVVAAFSSKRRRHGAKSANFLEPKHRKNLRTVMSENDRERSMSITSSRPGRDYTPQLPDLRFDKNKQLTMVKTRGISKMVKLYCPHCKIVFPDLIEFTIHVSCAHNYLTLFSCAECGTDYLSLEHLKNHEEIQHASTILCRICGEYLQNRRLHRDHVNKHILYSIPCNLCDFQFLTKREYEKHMLHVHKTRKRKIIFKKNVSLIQDQQNYSPIMESSAQSSPKPQDFFSKDYSAISYELHTRPVKTFFDLCKMKENIDNEEGRIREMDADDMDVLLSSTSGSSTSSPPSHSSSQTITSGSEVYCDTPKRFHEYLHQRENIDTEYPDLERYPGSDINLEQMNMSNDSEINLANKQPPELLEAIETKTDLNLELQPVDKEERPSSVESKYDPERHPKLEPRERSASINSSPDLLENEMPPASSIDEATKHYRALIAGANVTGDDDDDVSPFEDTDDTITTDNTIHTNDEYPDLPYVVGEEVVIAEDIERSSDLDT